MNTKKRYTALVIIAMLGLLASLGAGFAIPEPITMEYDPQEIFIDTTPALLGDCDGDGSVDRRDIYNVVKEIFDRDGNLAEDAPGGRFPGTPECDANADGIITVADIVRVVLIIYYPQEALSLQVEVGFTETVDLILPVAPNGLNGYVFAVTVPPQVKLVGFESDLAISRLTDGAVIAIDIEDIVQAGAVDTVIGTLIFEAVEVGTGEVTIEAIDTADDLFGVMNLVFPPIPVVVE